MHQTLYIILTVHVCNPHSKLMALVPLQYEMRTLMNFTDEKTES